MLVNSLPFVAIVPNSSSFQLKAKILLVQYLVINKSVHIDFMSFRTGCRVICNDVHLYHAGIYITVCHIAYSIISKSRVDPNVLNKYNSV